MKRKRQDRDSSTTIPEKIAAGEFKDEENIIDITPDNQNNDNSDDTAKDKLNEEESNSTVQNLTLETDATNTIIIPSSLTSIEFKKETKLTPEFLQLIYDSTCSVIKRNSKKSRKDETKRQILSNSVPYLLNSFGGTTSSTDQLIFNILSLYSNRKIGIELETMPIFGSKSFELLLNSSKRINANTNPNPLYIHSTRANTILIHCIDDKKAYHTCLHYNEAKQSSGGSGTSGAASTTDGSYNLEFYLPLLCHILNETNICDGSNVVANGWIYFIMKGISLENENLRKIAFLAYKRLLINFQQPKIYRNQDVKIWLHFLNAIRRGIQMSNNPKISHLLATWIIGIWKIIKEPTNSMFLTATHCLLAKPVVEVTILPDFVPFYNSGDDNKESRDWILSVLYYGLRTPEDWKIIQKSPFIKFLCSSFQLEKVKTQRTIIAILTHGTQVPEVVEELIDKYSILLWLANLKTTNRSLKIEIENFFYLLRDKSSKVQVSSSDPNENENSTKYNSFASSLALRKVLFQFVAKRQNWGKYASSTKDCVEFSSETIFSSEEIPMEINEQEDV